MLFHRGKTSNDRDRSVDKTTILRLPTVFFSLTMAVRQRLVVVLRIVRRVNQLVDFTLK